MNPHRGMHKCAGALKDHRRIALIFARGKCSFGRTGGSMLEKQVRRLAVSEKMLHKKAERKKQARDHLMFFYNIRRRFLLRT